MALRLVGVTGRPGAGKSSLIDALASELRRRGRRVAVLGGPETAADPIAAARRLAAGADFALVETASAGPLPVIEVHRRETGPPLYDRSSPDADQWIAVLTDDRALQADCRVFRVQDTMWLQFLAALAWDRAKVLP